jgi:hypothetical protein
MFLASLARWAYNNNGIVVAYVYGPMGYGKTSYALWTAYEILKDWDKVLDHLFFDLREAIEFLYKYVRKGSRAPIIILDDAGFFLNRLTWWEKTKVEFMELFNLARTMVACVIITSPTHEIPRQLLAKTNFRVSVTPIKPQEVEQSVHALEAARIAEKFGLKPLVAVAKGYRLNVLPSFMKFVEKEFIDYYPLHYPVFNEYNKIRMKYIKMRIEEIIRKLGKENEREQLLKQATEIYREKGPEEAFKFLIKNGIPRSTAKYWIKIRIPKLLGNH